MSYTDAIPTMNDGINWTIRKIGKVEKFGREMNHYMLLINGESFSYYQGLGIKKSAKLEDMLYCLLSDMQSSECSFEEFCDEFGYDTDSRKALETYLICQENGNRLRKALGAKFNKVKEEVERLDL